MCEAKTSHFLPVHTNPPLFPREMCSSRRIKAPLSELPRESGRGVGRISSRALAEPGGTAPVLPRGAGSSVGAQPKHRDLKFQKCDKAPAGPSAQEASSCRVTADEVAP